MMASLGAPATGEMRPSIRRGGWCRGSYDQHAPTIWLLPSTGRWNNVVRYWPGPPLRWRWPKYTYESCTRMSANSSPPRIDWRPPHRLEGKGVHRAARQPPSNYRADCDDMLVTYPRICPTRCWASMELSERMVATAAIRRWRCFPAHSVSASRCSGRWSQFGTRGYVGRRRLLQWTEVGFGSAPGRPGDAFR